MKNAVTAMACAAILSAGLAIGLGTQGAANAAGPSNATVLRAVNKLSKAVGQPEVGRTVTSELDAIATDLETTHKIAEITCFALLSPPQSSACDGH